MSPLDRLRAIPADVRLFLLFFVFLVRYRVEHTWFVKTFYIDGGYYLDVARHVRDGNGLASSLSLYHFGYEQFPHPTAVYPLWPWILGLAGRFGNLQSLAHWLPMVLSLLAVVLAFLFGRRLAPRELFPGTLPGFHAGHVFAILLALQRDFVVFTSLPYTEALGWSLVFGYLWRLAGKGGSLSLAWAVETGVWAGLAFYSRAQLMVLPLAIGAAWSLRIALGPDRRQAFVHALVGTAVIAAFVGGWWLHLRTFVHDADLGSLLRFDQARANDLLAPLDVIVPSKGVVATILDRLNGFYVAWDPLEDRSYHRTFHMMHWALPLAVVPVLVALGRFVRGAGVRAAVERLRDPRVFPWIVFAIFALGSLLSVHAVHKHYNGSWYFSKRQGLMSLPAFILPMWWLLSRSGGFAKVAGVVVFSAALAIGGRGLVAEANNRTTETRMAPRYPKLVAWLQKEADANGPLVVAVDANIAQRVVFQTENVGYHWFHGTTTYADMLTMTDRLGARYIVLRPQALSGWRFKDQAKDRLWKDFKRLPGSYDGAVILARNPGPPAPASAEAPATDKAPPAEQVEDPYMEEEEEGAGAEDGALDEG